MNRPVTVPYNAPISRIERGELSLDQIPADDPEAALQVIGGNYMQTLEYSDVAAHHRLQTSLNQLDECDNVFQGHDDAELTTFVPVGENESRGSVEHILALLESQSVASGTEVLLYGNTTAASSGAHKREFTEKLNAAVASANRRGELAVRSVVIPYKGLHIPKSRLRKNGHDLLMADSLRRGFSFNHPVTSFDVDTMHLPTEGNEELASLARRRGYAFTKANFSFEGMDFADPAVRYAMLTEHMGRLVADNPGHSSYPEESGSAVTLGNYALVGGYDTASKINETGILFGRINTAAQSEAYGQLIDHVGGQINKPQEFPGRILRPLTLSGRRQVMHWRSLLRQIKASPDAFKGKVLMNDALLQVSDSANPDARSGKTPFMKDLSSGGYYEDYAPEHDIQLHDSTSEAAPALTSEESEIALRFFFGTHYLDDSVKAPFVQANIVIPRYRHIAYKKALEAKQLLADNRAWLLGQGDPVGFEV